MRYFRKEAKSYKYPTMFFHIQSSQYMKQSLKMYLESGVCGRYKIYVVPIPHADIF